jgi:hypothetical protein
MILTEHTPHAAHGARRAAPGDRADEDDEVDFWEFVIDDDEGSQVVLRMSEPATRTLVRRIRELIGDALA